MQLENFFIGMQKIWVLRVASLRWMCQVKKAYWNWSLALVNFWKPWEEVLSECQLNFFHTQAYLVLIKNFNILEELWIIVGVGVFLYVAHNYVWRDDIASCLFSEFFCWQFFYRLRTTIWRIFYPRVECSVSEQEVLSQNVDSGTCLIVGVRWRLFLFSDFLRTTHCRYTFINVILHISTFLLILCYILLHPCILFNPLICI